MTRVTVTAAASLIVVRIEWIIVVHDVPAHVKHGNDATRQQWCESKVSPGVRHVRRGVVSQCIHDAAISDELVREAVITAQHADPLGIRLWLTALVASAMPAGFQDWLLVRRQLLLSALDSRQDFACHVGVMADAHLLLYLLF